MPLARVSGNSLISESALTNSLFDKTMPHYRRQPFPIKLRRGLFLFPACKSVNSIFARWCYILLFAITFAERGESHEKNQPVAHVSDECILGGKFIYIS